MSNQLDDFLISLGFDTSKIKSQVAGLEKTLNQVANKTAKQRESTAKKVVKQKLSDEMIVQKAIEKRQAKELKREEDLLKLSKRKADLSKTAAMSAAKIESARRQQEVRALLNAEKNPQLKAMGNYYRQMQSSLIGSKRLETRRRGIVNTVRNVGAYRDFAATGKGSDERKLLAQILLQARKDSREDKYYRVRQLRADLVKRGRDASLALKSNGKPIFDVKGYAQEQMRFQMTNGFDRKFQQVLEQQLSKAKTRTDVDRTIGTVTRISRYKGADPSVVGQASNVDQLKRYGEQLARNNQELNAAARRSMGLAAAQGSLRDSTRNLVREYASLYAIFAGTNYINQTGQAFEAMNSAMLAATGNTKDQKAEMQFMVDLSRRLGLQIKDVANEYVKFKFAAKGKLSTEQQQELFTNMSELGTVLGISQERMKLSMNAMSQMMSKTVVMSEELKGQLSESLPGAVQLFSKAMGVSEKELFKMMEQGKLVSADVLPKVAKEMKKAASAGGALEAKLGSVRVTQGQFFNELALSSDKVFGNGYSTGLAYFFRTLTSTLQDNEYNLKITGQAYNKFFTMLAKLIDTLTPVVTFLLRSLDNVLNVIQRLSDITGSKLIFGLVLMVNHMSKVTSGAKTMGAALAMAFRAPMTILFSLLALMDEFRAYFDEDIIGLFDDPNMSKKDQAIEAAQRRKMWDMGRKGDDKILGSAGVSLAPSFVQTANADLKATRQESNIPWWFFPARALETGASLVGTSRRAVADATQTMVFNIHGVADVAQLKREIQDAVVKSNDASMLMSSAGRD